tara:strand:- start:258 stop:551 length:294 start_codon:yes stop_codon:yes gene_type:complete
MNSNTHFVIREDISTIDCSGRIDKKTFKKKGRPLSEIVRERQFWKRVKEANESLGLGIDPSGLSYLDILQQAPLNVQTEFLKDAPQRFINRFENLNR